MDRMIHSINEKQPSECRSIDEVRAEIDAIDREIVNLLSTRLGYVHEVVKYKQDTPHAIEAADRRAAVLRTRAEWAAAAGLAPEVVSDIFDRLIQYFIEEEKKLKNI